VFPIRCVTTKGNPKLAGKLDVDDDALPLAFIVENHKDEGPSFQSLNKAVKALNKETKINTSMQMARLTREKDSFKLD
jgi:hypothetical protein